jgi:hypothetical protein
MMTDNAEDSIKHLMAGWRRVQMFFPRLKVSLGLGPKTSEALRYLGAIPKDSDVTRERVVAALDHYGVGVMPGGERLFEKEGKA